MSLTNYENLNETNRLIKSGLYFNNDYTFAQRIFLMIMNCLVMISFLLIVIFIMFGEYDSQQSQVNVVSVKKNMTLQSVIMSYMERGVLLDCYKRLKPLSSLQDMSTELNEMSLKLQNSIIVVGLNDKAVGLSLENLILFLMAKRSFVAEDERLRIDEKIFRLLQIVSNEGISCLFNSDVDIPLFPIKPVFQNSQWCFEIDLLDNSIDAIQEKYPSINDKMLNSKNCSVHLRKCELFLRDRSIKRLINKYCMSHNVKYEEKDFLNFILSVENNVTMMLHSVYAYFFCHLLVDMVNTEGAKSGLDTAIPLFTKNLIYTVCGENVNELLRLVVGVSSLNVDTLKKFLNVKDYSYNQDKYVIFLSVLSQLNIIFDKNLLILLKNYCNKKPGHAGIGINDEKSEFYSMDDSQDDEFKSVDDDDFRSVDGGVKSEVDFGSVDGGVKSEVTGHAGIGMINYDEVIGVILKNDELQQRICTHFFNNVFKFDVVNDAVSSISTFKMFELQSRCYVFVQSLLSSVTNFSLFGIKERFVGYVGINNIIDKSRESHKKKREFLGKNNLVEFVRLSYGFDITKPDKDDIYKMLSCWKFLNDLSPDIIDDILKLIPLKKALVKDNDSDFL